jgi:hypothetical protein
MMMMMMMMMDIITVCYASKFRSLIMVVVPTGMPIGSFVDAARIDDSSESTD